MRLDLKKNLKKSTTNYCIPKTDANKELEYMQPGVEGSVIKVVNGNPTFNLLNKNDVGLNNIDNTSDINKPISNATQTALNNKENILIKGNITSNDITITGGVGSIIGSGVVLSLNSNGRTRHFSGSEDVTNTISLQANIGDIYFNTATGVVYQKSNLTFPSGLSYITLPSGTWVKLGDFTLNKSKVGLSNVDNTSDINKPISTATQTALDGKENTLTKGNITSTDITITGGTGAIIGGGVSLSLSSTGRARLLYGTVDVTNAVSATANFGDLYINSTSKAVYQKTNLSFPNGLTYIVTTDATWVKLGNYSLTKSDIGLSNVDNTSDLNKPISNATQTALDSKLSVTTAADTYAPIISPVIDQTIGINSQNTFTGYYSRYSLLNTDFDYTNSGLLFNFSHKESGSVISQNVMQLKGNKLRIGNGLDPAYTLDVVGDSNISTNLTVGGNFTLNNISNVETEINSKLSSTTAATTYSALTGNNSFTGNNNFTGSNLFITPIFANSTSTSSFSSITGIWSNTGNLGIFTFRYNTKVGSNTVTWNPINMDANGYVGIGMNPSVSFEVLGASKFNSNVQASSLTVGTAISNYSVIFSVNTTTKASVPAPVMTQAEVLAISSPTKGMQVYNSTINQMCHYNGTEWRKLTDSTM